MSVKYKRLWFRKYTNQVNIVRRLEDKHDRLEKRITSIQSPSYTDTPRARSPISKEDLIADKLEIEQRIQRAKNKARSIRRDILEVIDSIEEVNLCDVLEYRYIEGLDPDEISDILGYNTRHIQRLLSQAVEVAEIPGLKDPSVIESSTDRTDSKAWIGKA